MTGDLSSAQEVNIDKQRLGEVYAKALLAAAEPQQMSETVVEELEAVVDEVLQLSPRLEATLGAPRVAIGEKEDLLNRILGGRVSDLLLRFLKVVGRHGRLDCVRHIRSAARKELNSMRNRRQVQLTTAEPLNDDQRHSIQDQLQRKMSCDVDLQCVVDPDILGGLIIRIGDTVFDSSVANRLARLRQETLPKTFSQLRDALDRFVVSS